jgi:hypothetical protein
LFELAQILLGAAQSDAAACGEEGQYGVVDILAARQSRYGFFDWLLLSGSKRAPSPKT